MKKYVIVFIIAVVIVAAYFIIKRKNPPTFKIISIDWESKTVKVNIDGEDHIVKKDYNVGNLKGSNKWQLSLRGSNEMNYILAVTDYRGTIHGQPKYINFKDKSVY